MTIAFALSILLALLQSPQTVFRADVNFVELDVSVLDKNRRPVVDLTAADFTVLEDGVPQKVESFEAVVLPEPVPPPATWWDDVPRDVESNVATTEGSLLTVVLDDEGVGTSSALRVKAVAHQIVEHMSAADRMAVVFTLASGRSQDYTTDRALLHEAIDRFSPGYMPPTLLGATDGDTGGRGSDRPQRMGAARYGNCPGVVEVVRQTARLGAAYAGRRKAAFVLSERIPAFGPGDCYDTLIDLFRDARRANLNVYPINPQGLTGIGEAELRFEGDVPEAMTATYRQAAAERTLAHNTGGVALSQTNAFGENLDRVFQENRSYYLIGYRSTNASTRVKLRTLAVNVAREGAIVRHRAGYWAGRAADGDGKKVAGMSPMASATASLLPSSALPLDATAMPVRQANGSAIIFVVSARPSYEVGSGVLNEEIHVRATLVNPRGEVQGGAERKLVASAAPVPGAVSDLRVPMMIEAGPGRYQLRIAASSRASGATGSVFIDVDVPDFDELPLTMSGVAIAASGDAPSLPLGDLERFVPFAPSTRRVFRPSHRVEAAVRIYTAGAHDTVALHCRILDADGGEAWSGIVSVEGGPAAGPDGLLIRCPVPLSRLKPGPFLLELDARAGDHTATRRVKFNIE